MSGGKSRSQNQSTQQSSGSSFGENQGGGFAQGVNNSSQNVWQPQGGALQNLYSGAQGAVPGAQGNVNQMNPQLQQSWQNLMNPGVNPQLQSYQNQVMQNFNENIMPAIGDTAQMAGGFGGSRQGVAQGVAARGANQQMTDMAGNLYNQDMNRMLQGIQMAPGVANFGMSPYQNLAGILGGATVLGESSGATNAADFSQGWQGSQQRSSGKSTGRSKTLQGGAS